MQSTSDRPPPYSSLVVPHDQERPPAYSDTEPPPRLHITAQPHSYVQVGSLQHQLWRPPPGHYIILATDNFVLTLIMMALCGIFLNFVAFIFLVPALIYSKKAASANIELNHSKARKLSQRALWLNIAAVISFIVVVIVGVLLGTVLALTLRD